MRGHRLLFLILFSLGTVLRAESVTGTVLIKKPLSKRSVTPSVSLYERGTAVELGKDADADPLVFERSRVVVYIEGPGPANPAPRSMQQVSRRFSPDFLVVSAGSSVAFPNMDPIFHNVFSLSKPKSFDLGNYPKGETRSVTFPKAGIVYVNCRLHPNMAAVVVVTPNQWFARPDSNGQYTIPEVPPGQYTLVAWHKSAGFFRKTIEVSPGGASAADFFIPIGDDAPKRAGK